MIDDRCIDFKKKKKKNHCEASLNYYSKGITTATLHLAQIMQRWVNTTTQFSMPQTLASLS